MLKKISTFAFLLCFSAISISSTTSDASVEDSLVLVSPVQVSEDSQERAVVFSKKYKKLTLKKSYNLQKAYVKNSINKGDKIVGFKAGLTAEGAPEQFGLTEPIMGVLLKEPLWGNKVTLSKNNTFNIMLEQEIAYKIAKKVTNKVTLENVMDNIESIAPAIEIPEMNFPTKEFNGLDIVANNALAFKLMVGEWQSISLVNKLNKLRLSLHCEGKEITHGQGNTLLGGQKNALVWLINTIMDQGYEINEGQILITGNLIKMTPAKHCEYLAKFGELGNLELLVTP